MRLLVNNIKGDRGVWMITTILCISSFLPIYSSSSNLAYHHAGGYTIGFLLKHIIHLFMGLLITYVIHCINFKYLKKLSAILLIISVILLTITLLQSTTINGANASRWIKLPFVGLSFQPSTIASISLMMYIAAYLSKQNGYYNGIKESALPLLFPIALVIILILPSNLSTGFILLTMCTTLMFIGKYPMKYLFFVAGFTILLGISFYCLIKLAPNIMPNRVTTWENRISIFWSSDNRENYQVEKSKTAIAIGGILGKGPGKSIQKNFLPQSSSDFIFAIIVEEYGIVGGIMIIICYLYFLFRITIVITKTEDNFGKLLVFAMGMPIVYQAFINIAVAVNLLPVTGQPLPFISSGGTSIWMNCLAVGIILNVSRSYREKMKRI